MSDYQDQYDEQDDQDEQAPEQPDQGSPKWRRDLEKRAKQADVHAKAAAEAQKELAFYKAGLPMSDPRLAYFVKGYDGEMTSEAIRTAAATAGFIDPPEPEVPTEELRAHDRVTQAAAGANTGVNEDLLEGARRAASQAAPGQEAQAYADYLRSKGTDKMRMIPG